MSHTFTAQDEQALRDLETRKFNWIKGPRLNHLTKVLAKIGVEPYATDLAANADKIVEALKPFCVLESLQEAKPKRHRRTKAEMLADASITPRTFQHYMSRQEGTKVTTEVATEAVTAILAAQRSGDLSGLTKVQQKFMVFKGLAQ